MGERLLLRSKTREYEKGGRRHAGHQTGQESAFGLKNGKLKGWRWCRRLATPQGTAWSERFTIMIHINIHHQRSIFHQPSEGIFGSELILASSLPVPEVLCIYSA
jgi:hypothetical protein